MQKKKRVLIDNNLYERIKIAAKDVCISFDEAMEAIIVIGLEVCGRSHREKKQ